MEFSERVISIFVYPSSHNIIFGIAPHCQQTFITLKHFQRKLCENFVPAGDLVVLRPFPAASHSHMHRINFFSWFLEDIKKTQAL